MIGRGSGRAATTAFVSAGTVAAISALTDYEGNGAGDGEATFFYSGAPKVVVVVAMTEWRAGERNARTVERDA